MKLLWQIREALTIQPVTLAYLCDTHPETGWLQFEGWRSHVLRFHGGERVDAIEVSYRNSKRGPDGSLWLGRMVHHT